MSQLVDCICTRGPKVDDRLNGKIIMAATAAIPDEIIVWMSSITTAVADQLEAEDKPLWNNTINCIFSDTVTFSLKMNDGEIAINVRIAFYPIQTLNMYKNNPKILCLILAEELCHSIWDISDEIEVNYKVFEVLSRIFPDLCIEELYSSEYLR